MSSQSYGNHTMVEAWDQGSGKIRQAPFRNNLTRRNLNILESNFQLMLKKCQIEAYQPHLHLQTLKRSDCLDIFAE